MYYAICKLYDENGRTQSSNVIAEKETYEKIRRDAEQTMREIKDISCDSYLSIAVYNKAKNGPDRHLAEWSYDGSQWDPSGKVAPEEEEGGNDGYEADRLRDHIKRNIADGTYEDQEKELVTWLFEELKDLRLTVETLKSDEKNQTEQGDDVGNQKNQSPGEIVVDFSYFTFEEFSELKEMMEAQKSSVSLFNKRSGYETSEYYEILASICKKLENVDRTGETQRNPSEKTKELEDGQGPGVKLQYWTYEENKPMSERIFGEGATLNSELIINKNNMNKLPTKSACCHAAVRFKSGAEDFGGDTESATQYMTCTACGNPCDIALGDESNAEKDNA